MLTLSTSPTFPIMRAILLDKLSHLDEELETLLTDLQQYDSVQLNRAPAVDSWSATQVLHHMLLSEKFSQQYCEKKLSFKPELKKAGLLATARVYFVDGYLRSPLKVKAPQMIGTSALPKEDELANIAKLYRAQRQDLQRFLEEVDEVYLDREVYKHPFGGRMSLAGMLDFLRSHFRHHRKQLYRALVAA
jgi:uncharacterized damage-inducible protein DinB